MHFFLSFIGQTAAQALFISSAAVAGAIYLFVLEHHFLPQYLLLHAPRDLLPSSVGTSYACTF